MMFVVCVVCVQQFVWWISRRGCLYMVMFRCYLDSCMFVGAMEMGIDYEISCL